MTTVLQNYINPEEVERAKPNGLIDTIYRGNNTWIQGRRGKAYFVVKENRWYFSACSESIPVNEREWYRVKEESLDFEKGEKQKLRKGNRYEKELGK